MYDIAEFEDSEAAFIKALQLSFQQLNINNVRVSTKRLPESKRTNEISEVVIRSTSKLVERFKVEEQFTIYVFCSDDSENIAFKKANELTRLTITAMRMVVANSNFFRAVTNISSSPFQDEGETQIRSALATVISYGNSRTIR